MVRKTLAVVAIVGLVALAGCAGMGSGGSSSAGGAPEQQAADGADVAASGGDGGGDGGGGAADAAGERKQRALEDGGGNAAAASVRVDRALIKTGQVTLRVENFSAAATAVRQRVAALGGYTSGSEVQLLHENNATWRTGFVEVRVPSANFSAMFESARGQGTVLSADSSTKDVTDKLVDLNARLENLKAQRDRLRSLFESANTTEELLQVQERLSAVQGEIERLEAKKRSLRNRVAFSTIRVELREPRPEPVDEDEPTPLHERSPVTVFTSSVQDFLTFARTVFVAGVAATPWALGLGIPALLLVGLVRRTSVGQRLPVVGRRSNESGDSAPIDDGSVPDAPDSTESDRGDELDGASEDAREDES